MQRRSAIVVVKEKAATVPTFTGDPDERDDRLEGVEQRKTPQERVDHHEAFEERSI